MKTIKGIGTGVVSEQSRVNGVSQTRRKVRQTELTYMDKDKRSAKRSEREV